MDKVEMYNKIINAIGVMSRVQGEDILFECECRNIIENLEFKHIYTIGEITVHKCNTSHLPEVFVVGFNVTHHLEDNHLKVILSTIRKLYDNKCKKLDEEHMRYAVEYLNSFVGK